MRNILTDSAPEGAERECEMTGIDPNLLLAKMGGGDSTDDKSWWLIMLILLFGSRGGNGFGFGDNCNPCCTPATCEGMNDQFNNQNVLNESRINGVLATVQSQNQLSEVRNNGILDRLCTLSSEIAGVATRNEVGQRDLRASVTDCCTQVLMGQKDAQRQLSDCCCNIQLGQKDIVNSIDKCCCETQNSIAMQTQLLSQAICNEGQKTRELLTNNRMQDLQTQLQVCRDENSNLRQTAQLSDQIREACRPHHHCWYGQGNGFVPPGQNGGGPA